MDTFNKLVELARERQQADILTLVDTPAGHTDYIGQMLIVLPDGEYDGLLIHQPFTELVVNTVKTLDWRQPVLIELDYNGVHRLFWDKLTERPRSLILGAGHISQPLVTLLALLGHSVTVVDDRPDFANVNRFPQAQEVMCQHFQHAMRHLDIDSYASIIIVTRGHRYDVECLRTVIHHPVPYIGMIGSRRRIRAILALLTEEGLPASLLARLRAPIGLDIGAQTPAEIALSIAAEVVAVGRDATYQPLSAKGRDHLG